MEHDARGDIYRELFEKTLTDAAALNRSSALRILGLLFDHARPTSVLDVGCGTGAWLQVAREMGVGEVRGVEGDWLDRGKLLVDPAIVDALDLEHPFSLGRRFDLVICLEVAEHLSPAAAEGFVASLAAHADLVLFSAAIPHQGGANHLNERFPGYWATLFAGHSFRPVDLVRPRVWTDAQVLWWLRQNTLLFAHDRALSGNARLAAEAAVPRALSIVHPEFYQHRVRELTAQLEQHAWALRLLAQGGTFHVTRLADGQLSIARQAPPTPPAEP